MKTINPFRFQHQIRANASKSDAQRCLILGAFSKSPIRIYGLGDSKDVMAMLASIRNLGAEYDPKLNQLTPIVNRSQSIIQLNVQESGFALRTLAFVGMAATKKLIIDGEGTLKLRKQLDLCHQLELFNFKIACQNHQIPIRISGEAKSGNYVIDGSESSQSISGICMLLSLIKGDSTVQVSQLKSRPYLNMTLQRMRDFGVVIQELGIDHYQIKGNQHFRCHEVYIEGDWSAAANHIVGAAISGEVQISGLNKNSLQADRVIVEMISKFGAQVAWKENELYVKESSSKMPFNVNIEDCPDLFPILVILACAAKGASQIEGTNRLINKESNRLSAMCEMLNTFMVQFSISENRIIIEGKGSLKGGSVSTFQDHRIAMAATIAACISENKIQLNEATCVDKSYPGFFNDIGL